MMQLKEESRKVSITKRGASAVCAGALLVVLAGVSGDLVLGSVGLATLVVVVADLAGSSIRSKRETADEIGAVKEERRLTSIAGESVELSVEVVVPQHLDEIELFAADPPFNVVGFELTQRGYTVDLKAKPEVYGEYVLGRLDAVVGSRLGFFRSRVTLVGSGRAEADKEGEEERGERAGAIAVLRVYPRFYPLMLEILSLLSEGTSEGEDSGARVRRLRRGEEYAWSRDYEPGDSTRYIDWKATARRGRLSVKEFMDAGGRGVAVFFDGRAPGRRSADEMARDLLSAMLGLVGTEQRVALFLYRDGGSYRRVEGSGEEGLRAALAEVFEVVVGANPEIFALFPPVVKSSLLRAIKNGGSDVDAGISVVERGAHGEVIRMAREGRLGDLVYVGCPLHGASSVIGMVSEVASCGMRVTALLPTKPWLDADTLEEAYEVRVSWERIIGAVRRIAMTERAVA